MTRDPLDVDVDVDLALDSAGLDPTPEFAARLKAALIDVFDGVEIDAQPRRSVRRIAGLVRAALLGTATIATTVMITRDGRTRSIVTVPPETTIPATTSLVVDFKRTRR